MNDSSGLFVIATLAFLMGLLAIPVLLLMFLLWLGRFAKTNKIKKAINWQDGIDSKKKNR